MDRQADFMNDQGKITFTDEIKYLKITRNITLKED